MSIILILKLIPTQEYYNFCINTIKFINKNSTSQKGFHGKELGKESTRSESESELSESDGNKWTIKKLGHNQSDTFEEDEHNDVE